MTEPVTVRQKVLEAARLTVQSHGYGGLSFRELAKEVGIKSASIHYYFPSKGDLVAAVAQKYTADYEIYLDGLLDGVREGSLDREACLQKYIEVFRATLRNGNRVCLGSILAAEHDEIPVEVRVEVVKYGEMNVRWLVKAFDISETQALAIFAALEGAQLVARSRGDITIYDFIVETYRANGILP